MQMATATETYHSVGLSESKRPLLLEGEVENLMQDGIAIYEGDKITKYEKGIATLTTHRLIWMDEYHKLAPIAIHLGDIQNVEADSGFKIKGSPKINFTLKNKILLKFSFRNGGRDPFFQKLQACLSRKAWEVVAPSQSPTVKKPASFDISKAGIGGLMKMNEQKAKETEQSLQEAFTDINALIQKAKDMVALAEKFKATAAKDQNQEEDSELRAVFLSMGIASPVTKESAGSMYHTQLSRQLSDWLQKPLERFGGMIALTDLYCLVNRARGTELISPEDLYRACVLFEELKLPVRLRRFESGVQVIQSLNQTDEAIAKQIEAIVKQEGPQTSFDLARNKNISISLANEQLLTAERLGVVCRDETFDGITFYLNFFLDRSLVKQAAKK